MITQIWKNKGKILEGLLNNTFKKEHVEAIANERLSICNTCPKRDDVGSTCFVAGTKPCCSVCGCSLKLKLRSLSSECPHPDGAKWKALVTEKEEDQINNTLNIK